VGTAKQLDITTAYLINQTGQNTDSLVERTLYTGLKNFLPAGTSYNTFQTKYKQGSQLVLPSISEDLKHGAEKLPLLPSS
jgi:SecD/SecF fusion protein